MGRYAQLVIGPAGSGKVGTLGNQVPHACAMTKVYCACSRLTVTTLDNTARLLDGLSISSI